MHGSVRLAGSSDPVVRTAPGGPQGGPLPDRGSSLSVPSIRVGLPPAAVGGPGSTIAALRAQGSRDRHLTRVTSPTMAAETPSQLIDARIEELGDWRGKTLSRLRALIKQADPEVVEEWKWRKASNPGVPVWSHQGVICTGETYKSVVKLTFFKGASLEDPSGLFNSSLGGNTRRAIDVHEDDEIDEKAFVALIQAAVSLNES